MNSSPGGGDIYTKPLAGGPATQVTTDPANEWMPVWSPDGSQIGFTSDRSGNYDIWVKSLAGGDAIRILAGLSSENHPTWSPSGTKIAYHSNLSGNTDIWVDDLSLSESSRVSLVIYDVSGRRVNRLISNQVMGAGTWQAIWNGEDFRNRAVPAGVYFYKLTTDEFGELGRMALVK